MLLSDSTASLSSSPRASLNTAKTTGLVAKGPKAVKKTAKVAKDKENSGTKKTASKEKNNLSGTKGMKKRKQLSIDDSSEDDLVFSKKQMSKKRKVDDGVGNFKDGKKSIGKNKSTKDVDSDLDDVLESKATKAVSKPTKKSAKARAENHESDTEGRTKATKPAKTSTLKKTNLIQTKKMAMQKKMIESGRASGSDQERDEDERGSNLEPKPKQKKSRSKPNTSSSSKSSSSPSKPAALSEKKKRAEKTVPVEIDEMIVSAKGLVIEKMVSKTKKTNDAVLEAHEVEDASQLRQELYNTYAEMKSLQDNWNSINDLQFTEPERLFHDYKFQAEKKMTKSAELITRLEAEIKDLKTRMESGVVREVVVEKEVVKEVMISDEKDLERIDALEKQVSELVDLVELESRKKASETEAVPVNERYVRNLERMTKFYESITGVQISGCEDGKMNVGSEDEPALQSVIQYKLLQTGTKGSLAYTFLVPRDEDTLSSEYTYIPPTDTTKLKEDLPEIMQNEISFQKKMFPRWFKKMMAWAH